MEITATNSPCRHLREPSTKNVASNQNLFNFFLNADYFFFYYVCLSNYTCCYCRVEGRQGFYLLIPFCIVRICLNYIFSVISLRFNVRDLAPNGNMTCNFLNSTPLLTAVLLLFRFHYSP